MSSAKKEIDKITEILGLIDIAGAFFPPNDLSFFIQKQNCDGVLSGNTQSLTKRSFVQIKRDGFAPHARVDEPPCDRIHAGNVLAITYNSERYRSARKEDCLAQA